MRSWIKSLPFAPTDGQRAAFDEIDDNLATARPMQRLLMGEVGSGKTVVALYAMLRAVESGHQAALMAPTETLAEQHAQTLDRLLSSAAIPFTLLTGSTKAAARRESLARLETGELSTGRRHACADRARCAVRAACRLCRRRTAPLWRAPAGGARCEGAGVPEGRRAAPHVLHMTATPIPRTLSLTAYGDLDATTLKELPAGRPAGEDVGGW